MEPNTTPSELVSETATKTTFKKHFCTVTPISKYLAMVIVIMLPFIGGAVGYYYAPETIVVQEVEKEKTEYYLTETDELAKRFPRDAEFGNYKVSYRKYGLVDQVYLSPISFGENDTVTGTITARYSAYDGDYVLHFLVATSSQERMPVDEAISNDEKYRLFVHDNLGSVPSVINELCGEMCTPEDTATFEEKESFNDLDLEWEVEVSVSGVGYEFNNPGVGSMGNYIDVYQIEKI